jgi:CDP-glucose 4,6-dehydratase
MHYLVTGHTGFKGSWLTILLKELGHKVSGLSLDPVKGGLFSKANLSNLLEFDERIDIRDYSKLEKLFQKISPDVVLHLAAQPIVRLSYQNPRDTIEINAIGTFNILEAVTKVKTIKAHLVITTDKVYKNINQKKGYRESDSLGGDDPYSASKAMADIVTQSFVKSFPGIPTAIARAGNVIGGGDVSKDRLIPDLISGFINQEIVNIRYPKAVRPWQHVLDCLNGYLFLLEKMLDQGVQGEWNFGPDENSFKNVETVANFMQKRWGSKSGWKPDQDKNYHEAELLSLDASKSQKELGWKNKLSFEKTLEWTVDWHKDLEQGKEPLNICREQISRFLALN